MTDTIITKVADLLVAAGWDRESAETSAPRFATTIADAKRPCPCSNVACQLAEHDDRHGDRNGYNHHRCRCRPCTRANTGYMADLRARTA